MRYSVRSTRHVRSMFLVAIAAAACGGGAKPKPKQAKPAVKPKPVVKKPETEADRETKRLAAVHELVAEGATCLPAVLKSAEAATLQLGVVDNAPLLCAIDADTSRLLGPIACFQIDTQSGSATYHAPTPVPGLGFPVRLDGKCARGYCLPDDVALPAPPIVHLAWSRGGDKVAVAIPGSDPEIHVFAAADKSHLGVVRPKDEAHADKQLPTELAGVVFVGDVLGAIGTAGDTGAPVFLFKTDGTPVGAVERLGGKAKGAVSVAHGSVSAFNDSQIALNEDALATLTTIEVATGKRAKLVRKPPKTSCKQKDIDALVAGGGDKVKDKCKAEFAKHYGPLIGATLVSGKKNHLALLAGDRYGELAVLDAKTLEENRHFAAPWCQADAEAAGGDDAPPADAEAAGSDE